MKSKFTWIFTLLLAFFIQFSFAQVKTVTGVVTDNQGMPIPGVNVVIDGTKQGVQTDFDGKYSIEAAKGQKLVFTFVGMATQTVTVGASSTISVQLLDDTTVLPDMVVEAYRTTTRATSNIAVTTITSKTIEGRPNANFMQTLQGQVPGLNISTGSGQPGSGSTVILRGLGSINGNIEPLYVIDGVPLNGDNFKSINPNDIESISVLKDAGATSIYGNRGANGVIIVKTKRGGFDTALNIKYTATTSFSQMQDNKYRIMDSKQLLTLERQVGRGYGSNGGVNGAPMTDEQIAAYNINTDWQDQFFRTATGQNHVLSLSSGSKNLTSFTSFGYMQQEGILRGTDLKRFSFRNNLTGKSNNDRFNYGTSLTINFSRNHQAASLGTGSVNYNPLSVANQGAPYISPDWYNGSGADLVNWYENGVAPDGVGYTGGQGTLGLSPLIILNRMDTGAIETDELKMIANITGSYKLVDNLTLGTSIGADYTDNVGLDYESPNSWTRILFARQGEDFVGNQADSYVRQFNFNLNTSLNYSKTFAEKHTIDASVFTEYYKAHQKTFSATQNGLDPKVWEPGNGAGYIPYNPDTPNFYVPEITSGKASAGLFSYFGSVDYDYTQRFGLAATVRRDASYRFAESNRWGTFWSVSGRWNIDKESFMEGSAFNMLKLRASYGTTGNQNILGQSIFSAPNLTRTLFRSVRGYQNLPTYVVGQLANPDLKWETIAQANIGVDYEVWKGRLRGTFDVYQKTTKDLYLSAPISGINGTYELAGNNGDLRNSGVEALVSYDLIRNNDFLLTVTFNGSYNKNEIISIPGGEFDNGLTIDKEGGQLNQFYLIKYAGVNPTNGNLLFYTKDGELTENPNPETDRRLTGKTGLTPTYQGGFGFEASYKGFYVTTQFNYVADIYRFDYDLEGLQDPSDIGVFNKSTDILNAWTTDNRNTDIPSLFLTNKGVDADSDRYLKDASYVRLRYASIGYNFKPELLAKTPFTAIKAFVQGENLVTWSKWRGWDAESSRLADQYQYPTPRIFSMGLELQF